MPTTGSMTRKVLSMSADPARREQLTSLLESQGFDVEQGSRPQQGDTAVAPPDVILLVAQSGKPLSLDLIRQVSEESYPPPVVVFGPGAQSQWRTEAKQAGAFACLSLEADPEDQAGILAAAARYRAAQMESVMLRSESERICGDLLKAFGDAAERLQLTNDQVQGVQKTLRDVQHRIIKVFA